MDTLINQLNLCSTIVAIGIPIINFLIGGIGLMFNVIVFRRPALCREPCSLYFFASTCFNLFVVFIIIPVRIATDGFNMDLANYNIGICKTEIFAFYTIRTISCWLIVLACFDRYLHSSTNARMRQLSSLKIAKLNIILTIVMTILLYSHIIIYYEITYTSDQFGNVTPACNGQKGTYRTFITLWYMTFYSLWPAFFMFLFGFLTLNNVRQQHRIVPHIAEPRQRNRRRDNQLLRVLVVQVLVIVVCTLPFSISRLYRSLSLNISKDSLRLAQENLAFAIANAVTYFAHSSSFYLYTLTGTVFSKGTHQVSRTTLSPKQTHSAGGTDGTTTNDQCQKKSNSLNERRTKQLINISTL